ncbi:hypothetical protein IV203_010407 [Nitzschia inconspicua]|uniref:Uncharacterized protein n=1 Tax=Nitzschia inconspicua TaxID=303405 RepID=A0A9K3KW79_9STRA|nr:hypothetical protein IV203_010407 [Nitzschia inconspicua]
MDRRDVTDALGLLGVVYAVSDSGAGGIEVATEHGVFTMGSSKTPYYVPSDRYSALSIQDVALEGPLEIVRQQINDGIFDRDSCKQLRMREAYDLRQGDLEADSLGEDNSEAVGLRKGKSGPAKSKQSIVASKKKGCR